MDINQIHSKWYTLPEVKVEQLQINLPLDPEGEPVGSVATEVISNLLDKLTYDAKVRAPLNDGATLTGWDMLKYLSNLSAQDLDKYIVHNGGTEPAERVYAVDACIVIS